MAKIDQKITIINDALKTLKDAIDFFSECEKNAKQNPRAQDKRLLLATRDSMIQRFEYCTDLFWKVLKIYLEEFEKIELPTYSPRGVIRETVKVKTVTEDEGERCMQMVTCRNETSHIYHEETAQNIAYKVPSFYELMKNVLGKVQVRVVKGK